MSECSLECTIEHPKTENFRGPPYTRNLTTLHPPTHRPGYAPAVPALFSVNSGQGTLGGGGGRHMNLFLFLLVRERLEPRTFSVRGRRSTNWAIIPAYTIYMTHLIVLQSLDHLIKHNIIEK